MEAVFLQQWGLFLRGLVLAALGVGFWIVGIGLFYLVWKKREKMQEEDENASQ